MPKRKASASQQRCAFCHVAGHKSRACPALAQKLLREWRRQCKKELSPSVFKVCSCEPGRGRLPKELNTEESELFIAAPVLSALLAKPPLLVRASGSQSNVGQRRGKTKNARVQELAEHPRAISAAWTELARRGLVRPGHRGCHSAYECPNNMNCRDSCWRRKLSPRDSDWPSTEEWLRRTNRPLHTVWFRGSGCMNGFNCLRFTYLPQRKYPWPLPTLVAFLREFNDMPKPNLQELCRRTGVSRCSTSRGLYLWLLQKEAFLGYNMMQKLRLRGVVEADGTALKLFKRKEDGKKTNCYVALFGLVERPRSKAPPQMVVTLLPVKKVAPNAVCPCESREDVLGCGALEQVVVAERSPQKVSTVLVSDGGEAVQSHCQAIRSQALLRGSLAR